MEVRGGREEGPEEAAAEGHRRARQAPAEGRAGGRSGAALGEPGLGFRASPERADQSRQPRPAGRGGRLFVGREVPGSELPPGLQRWARAGPRSRRNGGMEDAREPPHPGTASDPGDPLAGPPPLTPCAPARAVRCASLQPSQTRTARAPRRPLGCWTCPPPASLRFSCEPDRAARRGSPWPLHPLLVRPGAWLPPSSPPRSP